MLSFLLGFVTCYSVVLTLAYHRLSKQMLKQLGGFSQERTGWWNR